MSGFVSIIPPPTGTTDPVPATIEADGWFPSIDLADMRAAVRIDDTVTDMRLREAVRAAMLTCMNDLADWQADQLLAGHEQLGDVPAIQIDSESRLVLAWQRAIYCTAKADLIERYRDFDATASGDRNAQQLDPHVTDLRRDAAHALRDILGRRRTTVELI